jgi:hypothetical protein
MERKSTSYTTNYDNVFVTFCSGKVQPFLMMAVLLIIFLCLHVSAQQVKESNCIVVQIKSSANLKADACPIEILAIIIDN